MSWSSITEVASFRDERKRTSMELYCTCSQLQGYNLADINALVSMKAPHNIAFPDSIEPADEELQVGLGRYIKYMCGMWELATTPLPLPPPLPLPFSSYFHSSPSLIMFLSLPFHSPPSSSLHSSTSLFPTPTFPPPSYHFLPCLLSLLFHHSTHACRWIATHVAVVMADFAARTWTVMGMRMRMTLRMMLPVSHVTCCHGHWCVGEMGGRTSPLALLSTAVDYRKMSCDLDHVPAMYVRL